MKVDIVVDDGAARGFITVVSTEIEPSVNVPGRRKTSNLVPRLLRRQTARNISDPHLSASPPMPKSLQFNSAGGVSLPPMAGEAVAGGAGSAELYLPPTSVAFVAFPGTKNAGCS